MTVLRRFARDRRRSVIGWFIGISGYVLLQNAFYPSFKDQPDLSRLMEDLPEGVRAMFGLSGDVPLISPPGWLQSQVFSFMPILLVIFAVSLGARALATSEEDGTLELLLANPVRRQRVAGERLGAFALLTIVLGAAASAFTLATAPLLQLIEGVSIPGYIAATWGTIGLALLFGALSFGVGALTGRRSLAIGVSAAAAVGTYTMNGLAQSVEAAHGLRFLSPFYWFLSRNMLAQGVAIEALLLPIGFAALFATVGYFGFLGRDLRSS